MAKMNIQKIGFIGGGNMASSLISGLIASGHSPQHLWVSDINPDTLKALAENLNINTSASNDAVINEVDVIVLAVKPQTLSSVVKSVAALIQQKKSLVVSIAAGISQRSLSQWIGADVAIVYLNEHDDATETQSLVEREGKRCLLFAGDVGDEAFRTSMIHRTADLKPMMARRVSRMQHLLADVDIVVARLEPLPSRVI